MWSEQDVRRHAPFGEVAQHVVRVDGLRFHHVTAEVSSYERTVHETDPDVRDRSRHGGKRWRCNDIPGRRRR